MSEMPDLLFNITYIHTVERSSFYYAKENREREKNEAYQYALGINCGV